ncbi:MAG: hypothetical protein M3394_03945 [Actinomycetota bacterium]|nr:hypothetical protein [Actinomycetota bacterium]
MTKGHLDVWSTYMSVVDVASVDAFVAAVADMVSGEGLLAGCLYEERGPGFLCNAGWGDGQYPLNATFSGDRVTMFEVDFSLEEDRSEVDRWVLGGVVELPSGVALVGDPSHLSEFVPDLGGSRAVDACDLWAVMVCPGPGVLRMHVLKQAGVLDGRNLALQAEWADVPPVGPFVSTSGESSPTSTF